MLFRRWLCVSRVRPSKIDLLKQIEKIKASHVPELPVQETVALASQDISGKVAIDPAKSPLVMIHGLFGARQNYSSVGRQLSAKTHRQTIGVDMRNHGASSHVLPHDYTHMANDTIRFLESIGKEVVLAGHSMGAKVSMLVALQRPELVQKLIVIDNAPEASSLDSRFTSDLVAMCQVEQELHSHNMTQASLLKDVNRIMTAYEPDALVRMFLASNLKRPTKKAGHGAKAQFRVPVTNFVKHDVLDKMGEWPSELVKDRVFSRPVLVMRGLKSNFVRDKHLLSDFPAYFPNFRTVDFDCGHWLVSEQPEKFVNETLKFMEDQ